MRKMTRICVAIDSTNQAVRNTSGEASKTIAEVERLCPDVVVCSHVTPLVVSRVLAWVDLYPEGDRRATISIDGRRVETAGVELDDLLAKTPEPFEPLDAVMLDGYLCGVVVLPVLLEPDAWLPHVFDFDGQPLPDDADPAWRERVTALILRRHAALNRAIAEDGWFDPLILELDDFNPPRTDDPAASLNPVSQALFPWVAGFQHAMESFPDLLELPDPAIDVALARLYRHLPPQDEEQLRRGDRVDERVEPGHRLPNVELGRLQRSLGLLLAGGHARLDRRVDQVRTHRMHLDDVAGASQCGHDPRACDTSISIAMPTGW